MRDLLANHRLKCFRRFVEAELKALEGILARCEGQSVPTPEVLPVNKHLLSVEAEKWADKKVQQSRTGRIKTARMFLAAVRLFIEVRTDKDISEYKKDDARIFQDILLEYPAHAWKYPEFKDLTPKQIIQDGQTSYVPQQCKEDFRICGFFLP